MAKLDILKNGCHKTAASCSRCNLRGRKKQLDFRVSTLPTLWGEKIVMRLLDKENLRLDMTKLGFEPESLVKFENAILKPYGMVLVTGPNGIGQDQYALFLDRPAEYSRHQHHDRRGSG